eukprot:2560232-Pleurochrysis_carterae.AAC.2
MDRWRSVQIGAAVIMKQFLSNAEWPMTIVLSNVWYHTWMGHGYGVGLTIIPVMSDIMRNNYADSACYIGLVAARAGTGLGHLQIAWLLSHAVTGTFALL